MFLLGVPPSQNFKDNRWVSKYRLLKQLLTTKFIICYQITETSVLVLQYLSSGMHGGCSLYFLLSLKSCVCEICCL